jgi:hypothetical protein
MVAEEGQKDDSCSQRERDRDRETPKPPLPAFDLASSERSLPLAPRGSILKIERHLMQMKF